MNQVRFVEESLLKKFEVIRYARFRILELRNRVTQNAVTFQIINSKHFQVNNST